MPSTMARIMRAVFLGDSGPMEPSSWPMVRAFKNLDQAGINDFKMVAASRLTRPPARGYDAGAATGTIPFLFPKDGDGRQLHPAAFPGRKETVFLKVEGKGLHQAGFDVFKDRTKSSSLVLKW